MSGKFALIIGNTEYTDAGLARLTAPGKDAEDFARVLLDKEICAFDQVNVLLNQPSFTIIEAIDEFFDQKKPDDLLVLYFSGHGVRDDLGTLYLAVRNTNRSRLRSTAIKSSYVSEAMDQSRSRRQVLILDCCNSGAFPHGTKAATGVSIGTAHAFEGNGYGRVVLTASDATQFAWEGDKVIGETDRSLFTHFLVKGLEGEADKNRDGKITVDDLYNYAYEQIINRTPKQTPGKWSYKQQGEISLRQLTEAQREQLRLLEMQEQQRREQEEAERLARIKADREAAEQRAAELIAAREAAEQAARAATEKIAEEKARLDAAEREFAQQKSMREALEQSYKESSGISTAKPQPFLKKNFRVVALSSVIVIAAFGAFSLLRDRNLIPSVTPEGTSAISTEQTILISASEEPIVAPPEELTFTSVAAPHTLQGTPVPLPGDEITIQNTDQIVQLARWGKGYVNQTVYSPDGKNIALGTSIGIYLLDAATLDQIRFIDTNHYIHGLTFTPDGETIIAVSNHGDILKFRTNDGTFIQGTKGIFDNLRALSFSPDRKTVALVGRFEGESGYIFLTHLEDGTVIRKLDLKNNNIPLNSVSLAFSPDGQILASITISGVHLWDPKSGNLLRTLDEGPNYYGWTVAFSPDGTQFAYVASEDRAIKVINPQDGALIQSLEGDGLAVWELAFSADGQTLFYGAENGNIRIRQVSDASLLQTLQGHAYHIRSIVFSPDGKYFATAAEDSTVKVWDTEQQTIVKSIDGFLNRPYGMAVSSDDQFVISASERSSLWQIKTGEILQTITWTEWWNIDLARSTDEQIFAVESSGHIRLWKITDGHLEELLQFYADVGQILILSPNGAMIAVNNYDKENTVELRYVDALSRIASVPRDLKGHTSSIEALAFSPDNKVLASGSWDTTIHLWNTQDGEVLRVLKDHVAGVTSLAFSPDGKILASSSWDGSIILSQVEDGVEIRTMELPAGVHPYNLAFSPDGQTLASGSSDGTIRLLDTSNGTLLQTLAGHTMSTNKIAFTTDGKLLISSSDDGTIRLWGVKP